MNSLLSLAILAMDSFLGHTASQARVFVQLPKPSSSIFATIALARLAASTRPCGSKANWLLDEIEKASHDVFNILLQVMDEGRLTDSSGVTVDFKNTIIIFTSNIGSREVSDFGRGIGFSTDEESREKDMGKSLIMKSINKHFAPEFINRLDEIIMFNPLTKDGTKKIAQLELDKLRQRMSSMGYQFTITRKAMDFLVEKGYDHKYGARPLKRAIQTYIENGLGSLIMEGEVGNDHIIHISKKTGKDELAFS